MVVEVYKPQIEIKIMNDLSSLEKADILESLSLMINGRGLMSVSVEDLEILEGRPCESFIGYSEKNVEDALETFCRKTAPDDIQAMIIYAWTSNNNIIREAHALEDFVESCSDMYGFTIKWGISRVGKEQRCAKLLVLFTTEKAAPNETTDKKIYQVEENFSHRKVMLPLGVDVKIKKGDINWEFFK